MSQDCPKFIINALTKIWDAAQSVLGRKLGQELLSLDGLRQDF